MKHIHTCIGDQTENEWTTCSFKELNLNRYVIDGYDSVWFCSVKFHLEIKDRPAAVH